MGLQPNTTYEVEVLTKGSRMLAATQISTWREAFPVGTTISLPTNSSSTLNITTSGTANAYRIYTAAPGGSSTIDGANGISDGVFINASYVILRGITIRNVRNNGISIGTNAHHVVIEDNDIYNFGHKDTLSQYGCNDSAGIRTSSSGTNFGVTNVVIQNNKIHHPNVGSNSWEDPARPYSPGCGPPAGARHPAGSAAIYFKDTGGNHVIRYNEIYSDFAHMFDDGISGGQNFSHNGDLRRDSDNLR